MPESRWVCGTLASKDLRDRDSSGSRAGTADALGTGSMSSYGGPRSNEGVWEDSLRLRRVSRYWLGYVSVWCSYGDGAAHSFSSCNRFASISSLWQSRYNDELSSMALSKRNFILRYFLRHDRRGCLDVSLRIVSNVCASVVVGFIISWSDMVTVGVVDGYSIGSGREAIVVW